MADLVSWALVSRFSNAKKVCITSFKLWSIFPSIDAGFAAVPTNESRCFTKYQILKQRVGSKTFWKKKEFHLWNTTTDHYIIKCDNSVKSVHMCSATCLFHYNKHKSALLTIFLPSKENKTEKQFCSDLIP